MAEEAILGHLEKNVEISDSGDFASQSGIDHNEIVNVIKSLHGFRLVDAQVPLSVCFPRKSSTIRFFSFVSVLRQYMTSVRFSCMFCRISRGKSGCSPMKASYMLRLAHRKCNCSWPYHLRAYHEKNCRFIFINFVKLAN